MTGNNIRELREKNGLTQKQLAQKIGVSASTVGMYEQNRRVPDADMLKKIASSLKVSTDVLISGGKSLDSMIDDMRGSLMLGGGMMFNGEPLSEDDIDAVIEAMKIGARVAIAASRKKSDEFAVGER